jgi:arsenate reductase
MTALADAEFDGVITVFEWDDDMKLKPKVLFLCTGNSCRSQMAEGWARKLKGDEVDVWSAGITTHGLNPLAVQVMAEAGVDISTHKSKSTADVMDVPFDYVVTVCGHANETCPTWLGAKAKVIHHGFDDPPKLAANAKSEEEALGHYRRVRDEIRRFVETLPDSLPPGTTRAFTVAATAERR